MSPCCGAHSSSLGTREVVDIVANNQLSWNDSRSLKARLIFLLRWKSQSIGPGIGMARKNNTHPVDSTEIAIQGVQGHRVHLIKAPDSDALELSYLEIKLHFEAIPGKDVQ